MEHFIKRMRESHLVEFHKIKEGKLIQTGYIIYKLVDLHFNFGGTLLANVINY